MSSRYYIVAAAFVCSGCQTLDSSLFSWMSPKTAKYTESEVAALNEPTPAASRPQPKASAPSQPAVPVAAGRVEQLVQHGQGLLRDGGQSDPTRLQQAREVFGQALSLDNNNAAAHHGIAITADLQQDWKTAELHYKQALRLRPQDAGLLNDIGYSYLLQKRYFEASEYLNQAVQTAPGHEHAHINLAMLALSQGDRNAAQSQLAKVYPASQVQTTLARLETDLRNTAGQDQSLLASAELPANASFEEAKRLMEQERQRAHTARQEKEESIRNAAFARSASMQMNAAGLTSNQNQMMPQHLAQQPPQQQYPQQMAQTMPPTPQHGVGSGQPNNLYGSYGQPPQMAAMPDLNAPVSVYPTPMPQPPYNGMQNQNMQAMNYPNQNMGVHQNGPFAGQSAMNAPFAAAPIQPQPQMTSVDPHAAQQYAQYPPQFAAQASNQQGLIQQLTQSGNSPQNSPMGPQGQTSAGQFMPDNYGAMTSAQRGPVTMGLNVGPDALFPISAGTQNANMNSGMPTSGGTAGQGRMMPSVQPVSSNIMSQAVANQPFQSNVMYQGQPMRVLPVEQHLQQMHQSQQQSQQSNTMGMPYNNIQPGGGQPMAPAFGPGGVVAWQNGQNPNPYNPPPGVASPNAYPNGYNAAQQLQQRQPAAVAAPNPLATYEAQLQGLNTQYNQAMQQVNGSRPQMNTAPANY